jgi:hypothetical protein
MRLPVPLVHIAGAGAEIELGELAVRVKPR